MRRRLSVLVAAALLLGAWSGEAAEKTLKTNPDDPRAALVVGSENFCVTCHRRDAEWR